MLKKKNIIDGLLVEILVVSAFTLILFGLNLIIQR